MISQSQARFFQTSMMHFWQPIRFIVSCAYERRGVFWICYYEESDGVKLPTKEVGKVKSSLNKIRRLQVTLFSLCIICTCKLATKTEPHMVCSGVERKFTRESDTAIERNPSGSLLNSAQTRRWTVYIVPVHAVRIDCVQRCKWTLSLTCKKTTQPQVRWYW